MHIKRLAIIGGGSSGLITLKNALELLPEWDVRCFERSDSISGAWGFPYPGFVSTSTKYTTQFSCFPEFDASVAPDGGASRSEFFRDAEYGAYLNRFADRFNLRPSITHGASVDTLRAVPAGGWDVLVRKHASGAAAKHHFDAVVVCTGLVAHPRPLKDDPRVLELRGPHALAKVREITGKRIVVVGGGEMAADFAHRLAADSLGNDVYLSLRSGIRVSPRYHPIRGVPSDFLRNRLMLSIHDGLRNQIGKWFVGARMRFEEHFERLFPHASPGEGRLSAEALDRRKLWARKLTSRSKGALFDVFHNKSDDFLTDIAEGRLRVVGPPIKDSLDQYREFDGDAAISVDPEVILPALGFRSRIDELTGGEALLADFYLGCRYVERDDLFLVGFARPVIGNIPSISEMQARYVCSVLAGRVGRPANIACRNAADRARRQQRFSGVNLDRIYPVEMFPYCDRIAREAGIKVRPSKGFADWWRVHTAPATTLDYECFTDARSSLSDPPTYLPTSLVVLLLMLKPLDWVYRLLWSHR